MERLLLRLRRDQENNDCASRHSFSTVTAALMPSSDDPMMIEPIEEALGVTL
jgi:hypothetical protein